MFESTFGLVAIVALAVCLLLLIAWKVIKARDLARMRRDEEMRRNSGGGGICRYGVNAAGEIVRIRVKPDRF
jgi:hypothetical protein